MIETCERDMWKRRMKGHVKTCERHLWKEGGRDGWKGHVVETCY